MAPCAEPQAALTACASRAVPMLKQVKEQCGAAIRAYDLCLQQNAQGSDEHVAHACTPKLRTLWECTERVKAAQAPAK